MSSIPGTERIARSPHGARVIIHATAEQTGGTFGIWETFTPPGKGPDLHTHTRETEVFRVMSGTYRFWCGDEVIEGPPGTVVVLPPHIPHRFQNVGSEPGSLYGIVTPGGFEQLFIDIEATHADTPAKVAVIEARLGVSNDETRKLLGG